MGLLDDAIREHMELKRLRGADPSEVARQEKDALGSILREGDPVPSAAPEANADPEEASPGGEDSSNTPRTSHDADFGNVGQETAELDMRTVLDEEGEVGNPESHADPVPPAGETGEHDEAVEDVLEETPDFLRDTPEQDRLWFEQQPPRDFDFDK
jgi:hypothetical protein